MAIISGIQVNLPVIHVTDSNDRGEVLLNLTGDYTAFEADLVAYIKTKIAAVSGTGTVTAVKTVDSSSLV